MRSVETQFQNRSNTSRFAVVWKELMNNQSSDWKGVGGDFGIAHGRTKTRRMRRNRWSSYQRVSQGCCTVGAWGTRSSDLFVPMLNSGYSWRNSSFSNWISCWRTQVVRMEEEESEISLSVCTENQSRRLFERTLLARTDWCTFVNLHKRSIFLGKRLQVACIMLNGLQLSSVIARQRLHLRGHWKHDVPQDSVSLLRCVSNVSFIMSILIFQAKSVWA